MGYICVQTNVATKNVEELEKPDSILQRKFLSNTGNPFKILIMLELGLIQVRYILMTKQLQFLHYLLSKRKNSMLQQVFNA